MMFRIGADSMKVFAIIFCVMGNTQFRQFNRKNLICLDVLRTEFGLKLVFTSMIDESAKSGGHLKRGLRYALMKCASLNELKRRKRMEIFFALNC